MEISESMQEEQDLSAWEKQLSADGDVLCDLCHGTAMRLVIWWTFQREFGEGQYGSGLNNEMIVSPHTIPIMCCFSSGHIKIPLQLFWQQDQKIKIKEIMRQKYSLVLQS